ncbi:MAG: PEGA domain-containing protein [Polyangiales bacterium]
MPRRALEQRFTAGALALALLGAAASARAQRPSSAERAGVRRTTRAADEAWDRGDLEGALQLYQAAFRADPLPALRRRLADCYESLRRPLEAVHHLERFLEESREASASERDEVAARIRTLRAGLATLHVRVAPRDVLDLAMTVDGLTIGPDGTTQVSAGTHRVEAAAEGYRPVRTDVHADPGATVDVTISLRRTEIAPTVALAPAPVAPRPTGLSPGAFFGALGGTVAAAAVWTAAGVSALDARAAYDSARRALATTSTPELLAARAEALARMQRDAVVSDVALGVTAAGAVLTAVLASRTDFRGPAVELDASAAPGGWSLGVRGRF